MELRDWYELIRIQLKREEGQTMAEYGLLIALIAILLVSTLLLFKGALITTFTNITNSL
jgi:Flp pilus assembly pilin Flp